MTLLKCKVYFQKFYIHIAKCKGVKYTALMCNHDQDIQLFWNDLVPDFIIPQHNNSQHQEAFN